MLGCSVLRFTWCGVDTDALQVVASFLQVFRSSVYMGQPISVRRTCQPSTERGTFKFNWSGAPNILVMGEFLKLVLLHTWLFVKMWCAISQGQC